MVFCVQNPLPSRNGELLTSLSVWCFVNRTHVRIMNQRKGSLGCTLYCMCSTSMAFTTHMAFTTPMASWGLSTAHPALKKLRETRGGSLGCALSCKDSMGTGLNQNFFLEQFRSTFAPSAPPSLKCVSPGAWPGVWDSALPGKVFSPWGQCRFWASCYCLLLILSCEVDKPNQISVSFPLTKDFS